MATEFNVISRSAGYRHSSRRAILDSAQELCQNEAIRRYVSMCRSSVFGQKEVQGLETRSSLYGAYEEAE